MNPRFTISFVGAGKVATALAMQFHAGGHRIGKIVSPTAGNGKRLADACSSFWSAEPVFAKETDLVIVAVPDQRLVEVLSTIICEKDTAVVHTAGSYGIDIFPGRIPGCGVLYPLQTFSYGRKIDFREIPFFTEASNRQTGELLFSLAQSLGCRIYRSDAGHRRLLHVAAVFVSNFTNHLLTSGKMISAEAGFDFEVLKPLIKETLAKAVENGPEESQTGPAIRYDINTIKKHMELLSFSPEMRSVYETLSRSIMEHYKPGDGNEQL